MFSFEVVNASLQLAPVTVIAGHYGVGKTNLSLNLALDAARGRVGLDVCARDGLCEGAGTDACADASAGSDANACTGSRPSVTLVDLDVVNPYFRASEYRGLLEEAGVSLVAPVFSEAGTSLDVPSLTGAILPAIQQADESHLVVIDAGGDDVGATSLGRFAPAMAATSYAFLYVLNPYRNLTHTPDAAIAIMREIEQASRLRATALVSNAHLKEETDCETIRRGIAFAQEASAATGLTLACATVPYALARRENACFSSLPDDVALYPVRTYVETPWETERP